MASLAEIRAKLQAANQQSSSAQKYDNAVFPHWNIKENTSATVRFLPDGDPNNTFFWAKKTMIRLPFKGVKGAVDSKETFVQVPCMEMYGKQCPIITEIKPWWNAGEELEKQARVYWKKPSYILQGFVVNSDLKEEEVPENPIRRFVITNQIYKLIEKSLLDPEIEETPTDYLRGLDFKITKTIAGGYSSYTTSSWSRRERSLSDEELAAIDQFGLSDLKTFLPKEPGEAELRAIMEMFEASVDGEAYDPERWGQFYKPAGLNMSNSGESSEKPAQSYSAPRPTPSYSAPAEPVAAARVEPVVEAPVQQEQAPRTSAAAMDILARINARKAQQQ